MEYCNKINCKIDSLRSSNIKLKQGRISMAKNNFTLETIKNIPKELKSYNRRYFLHCKEVYSNLLSVKNDDYNTSIFQ